MSGLSECLFTKFRNQQSIQQYIIKYKKLRLIHYFYTNFLTLIMGFLWNPSQYKQIIEETFALNTYLYKSRLVTIVMVTRQTQSYYTLQCALRESY